MLYQRLRQLRKQKGYTQEQLASHLNISRGTYAHYEIGKRKPDYDTLLKLSEFFNVDADYLLGGKPSESDLSPDEAKLLEELKKEAAFYDFLDADEEKKNEIIEGLKLIIRGGLYKRDDK